MSKFDIELIINGNLRIESNEHQIMEFAQSPIYEDLKRVFRRELAVKLRNLVEVDKEHGDVIADQAMASLFIDYQDEGLIESLLKHKAQDMEEENG